MSLWATVFGLITAFCDAIAADCSVDCTATSCCTTMEYNSGFVRMSAQDVVDCKADGKYKAHAPVAPATKETWSFDYTRTQAGTDLYSGATIPAGPVKGCA